jgi:hypothetical protein
MATTLGPVVIPVNGNKNLHAKRVKPRATTIVKSWRE